MRIAELPDDILVLILRQATATNARSIREWKSLLVLLSVCSHWRHIAFPAVYGQALAVLKPTRKCKYKQWLFRNRACSMSDVDFVTNIYLITAHANVSAITRITVDVDYATGMYSHVCNMVELLVDYQLGDAAKKRPAIAISQFNVPAPVLHPPCPLYVMALAVWLLATSS
ncbi:hypothetical protein H4R23_000311 [Coemansia sp. Cherry 401B]|nr:hypothetical protein IWW54_001716 [Coemansia sp. RSA 2705]KAJ2322074.1 hypothetical protein IWW52_000331 [Coemansia sp. RSA 2704]KAJ2739645.1 hypothetical protein H4R23_000311 [Coemansia sp. Cherry 401B]